MIVSKCLDMALSLAFWASYPPKSYPKSSCQVFYLVPNCTTTLWLPHPLIDDVLTKQLEGSS